MAKLPIMCATGTSSKSFSLSAASCGEVTVSVEEVDLGGGGGRPTNVIYVDEYGAPVSGQDGSLAAPFASIQQAVTKGRALMSAAQGLARGACIIMVAPGFYTDDVAVPAPPADTDFPIGSYVIQAWSQASARYNLALPRITGNFTVAARADHESSALCLTSLALLGTFSAVNKTADRLYCPLRNCYDLASYEAAILTLTFEDCERGANDIIGHTSVILETDGATWASGLNVNTITTPSLNRSFYDTGVDNRTVNLAVHGLAVGSSALATLNYPTAAVGDWAIWQSFTSPADYTMNFVGCNAGEAVFRITNVSRVSGTFEDDGKVLLLHGKVATTS